MKTKSFHVTVDLQPGFASRLTFSSLDHHLMFDALMSVQATNYSTLLFHDSNFCATIKLCCTNHLFVPYLNLNCHNYRFKFNPNTRVEIYYYISSTKSYITFHCKKYRFIDTCIYIYHCLIDLIYIYCACVAQWIGRLIPVTVNGLESQVET